MRHEFRWVVALLVLVLMLPAAAGALPAPRTSSSSHGWNPWSRLVELVSALFGAAESSGKKPPRTDSGCGYDPTGAPKCDS